MSIEALIKQFEQQRKEFQEKAGEGLKVAFKEMFDKNPSVKAVVWTQYAPYFNDGEPCVFSIHGIYATNAEGDDLEDCGGYEYDGSNEDVMTWDGSEYDEKQGRADWVQDKVSVRDLLKCLNSNPLEDVLEATFGSDAKVIATRSGFAVEEFDHD